MADNGDGRVTGRVKFFDTRKGFGFIKPDDGTRDVFIGINFVPDGAILSPDQPVSYLLRDGKKGPWARDLALL